ncbi:hypothetical protein NDU88_002520 [Pleurodeles waltl]|uniref:Uncharacterized protein n=1 Tax=Pleurodeles waltl TaxID=8319 RepID=A0AAV7KVW8_PLEWA|nr:hypothetical protein NDU88_002520 [Pleurodeles waltl]
MKNKLLKITSGLCLCDGSDRSDPHTIAPSAISAGVDPEATQRAVLPIGSVWYSRDERDVKREVPLCQGSADGRSGNLQEAAAEKTRRLERIKEKRNPRSSGVPEDRTRLEQGTLTVPTQDEDCRPREAYAYDLSRLRRSVAKPGTELGTGREGGKREKKVIHGERTRARALGGRYMEGGEYERGSTVSTK